MADLLPERQYATVSVIVGTMQNVGIHAASPWSEYLSSCPVKKVK